MMMYMFHSPTAVHESAVRTSSLVARVLSYKAPNTGPNITFAMLVEEMHRLYNHC